MTYEKEQSAALDEIIMKNEITQSYAQDLYNRLIKPQKGFQFRPIEANKPPKLTLTALKGDWETLSGWKKKMQDYCMTGLSDPEALEHTHTIRSIIKGALRTMSSNTVKQN